MNQRANGPVRIDKWLWATRVYKTRTLATDACKGGSVKIDNERVKPSHLVKPGEIIEAKIGDLHKTIRVLELLDRRVSAAEVPRFCEDLTDQAEYRRVREQRQFSQMHRPKGMGRPTKKDRRDIRRLFMED